MAFDVVRKRISRASKWQRLEVSISIRTDFSCYLITFLMQLQFVLLFDVLQYGDITQEELVPEAITKGTNERVSIS